MIDFISASIRVITLIVEKLDQKSIRGKFKIFSLFNDISSDSILLCFYVIFHLYEYERVTAIYWILFFQKILYNQHLLIFFHF